MALYLALHLAWLSVVGGWFLTRDPALLERRLTRGEKDPLQRVVIAVMQVLGLATLAVAGLDRRFGWSALHVGATAAGVALFVAGGSVVFAVFAENTYTSNVIDVEPAQTVVATGPYRVVRHPMYLGTLLMGVALPLVLGSIPALLFVVPGQALLVGRILAEERFLMGSSKGMPRTPGERPSGSSLACGERRVGRAARGGVNRR